MKSSATQAPGWQFLAWSRTWLAACRRYYTASTNYEELSRLSDAELKRRGLNRRTLGQDVCERNDRDASR